MIRAAKTLSPAKIYPSIDRISFLSATLIVYSYVLLFHLFFNTFLIGTERHQRDVIYKNDCTKDWIASLESHFTNQPYEILEFFSAIHFSNNYSLHLIINY